MLRFRGSAWEDRRICLMRIGILRSMADVGAVGHAKADAIVMHPQPYEPRD